MQDSSLLLMLLGVSFLTLFQFILHFCMTYIENTHPVCRLPFLTLTTEHTSASNTNYFIKGNPQSSKDV